MPAATQHALSFDQALEGYLRAHGQLTFLRIGGDDGAGLDLLRKHILKGELTGVIVAPDPQPFARLQALYAGSDRIRVENGAILAAQAGSVSGPGHGYDTLVTRQGLQQIDLLQIDTGGDGYELLKGFDFQRFRPALVHYDNRHLDPQDRAAAEELLRAHGYVLNGSGQDILALRGVFHTSGHGELSAVIRVADALFNEERYAQAIALYDHVLQVRPDNLAVAINAAQAAARLGDHVDALRRVTRFDGMSRGAINLKPYANDIKARAAIAYNAKVSANDLEGAAGIIEGLIELEPARFLSIGLSVVQALGRTEQLADYASRLLQIDPGNWYAHFVSSEVAKQRGETAPWLYHGTRAILLRPWTAAEQHLSISSIVYYFVADVLAHPECPEALGYVNELQAKVSATTQNFSEESDRAFDAFIRVSLDAVDVSVLERPLAEDAPPQPALTFADTGGTAMTAGQWTQRIQALSPRVVFLAAADEVYLQRYGSNYVRTILDRCDVDCALVIGLVGEAKRLKSLIETIGVTDPRLFYLVDEFDLAYAVSYYSSKMCRTGCANAYYQSFRFLVLEYLLTTLQVPFIVTDIDLHLQGSIAGLLERHAGRDIVLNRNVLAASYGSRFTANLTLFRPGRAAQQFSRTLRLFLEQALKRQHIEQFIDQTAFSLANYYCRRHGLDNTGHFVETEINNLMLNRAGMEPGIAELAKSFVFFAYYGSQGDSALALMKATAAQT